ncbi:hypothetical protein PG993_002758 [Apiospora rasikravindrae]|uniref:Uncharacterized protein n=1 Tax=Apiospora rasikravindrae TaxID=990691 RepID=A0ABR1TXJ5_9PEZI
MVAITPLVQTILAVADFRLKGYSDANCGTMAIELTDFASFGCLKLPDGGMMSVSFDSGNFKSGNVEGQHFVTEDCTGPSIGQANFLDANYTVPDGQCVNATMAPDAKKYKSFSYVTYR